jgi:hypothetical protein
MINNKHPRWDATLACIRANPDFTVAQIAAKVGVRNKGTVYHYIRELKALGKVRPGYYPPAQDALKPAGERLTSGPTQSPEALRQAINRVVEAAQRNGTAYAPGVDQKWTEPKRIRAWKVS